MSGPQQAFEIRRIELEDEHLLAQFYQEHFADKGKLNNADLWQWEFKRNPFATEVPFFVIRGKDAVHGGAGAMLSRVQVKSDSYDACHPVDFFVEDEFKGFPALRLFRKIIESRALFYASYVSDDAEKLFLTAGFLQLNDHLKRFHYSLRPDSWVPGDKQQARSLAAFFARLAMAWRCRFQLWRRASGRYTYRAAGVLVDEWIPAAERQKLSGRIGLLKDAKYVRWRYQNSPSLNCTYFCQFRDGEPLCSVVMHEQPQDRSVVMLDVIRATDDALEIACALVPAIGYYRCKGYRVVGSTLLSKQLAAALMMLGFSAERSDNRFMFYSRNKELKDQLNDPDAWDFNLGDTDVY